MHCSYPRDSTLNETQRRGKSTNLICVYGNAMGVVMKFLFLFVLLFSFSSHAGQNVKLEFDLNVQGSFAKKTRFFFVVDNSGSMQQNQGKLQASIDGALNPFVTDGLPFDVTILYTESFDTGFLQTIDGSDPDVINVVKKAVIDAGTNGNADERTMDSLEKVKSQISIEESLLNFVILSDEMDHSQNTDVATFVQTLTDLNAGRADLLNLYVIAQDEPAGCRGGSSDGNVLYDEMIKAVGNNSKRVQICDPAVIDQLLTEVGTSSAKATKNANPQPVYMPIKSIQLGMNPVFDTLKVSFGNQVFMKGSLPDGYVYYQTENKILFGDKVELKYFKKGTKLVIEYESEDDVISTESADSVANILELH